MKNKPTKQSTKNVKSNRNQTTIRFLDHKRRQKYNLNQKCALRCESCLALFKLYATCTHIMLFYNIIVYSYLLLSRNTICKNLMLIPNFSRGLE